MSDSTKNRMNPIRSIFVAGVGIVALATGIVCGVLFTLSGQMEHDLAENALQKTATEVTTLVGDTLGGAVRFKNIDALNDTLEATREMAGEELATVAAVDVTGQVIASLGAPLDEGIAGLAARAISEDRVQYAETGIVAVSPIHPTPGAAPVGAFVTVWSKEPMLAAMAERRRTQLLIVGAVFLVTLIAAGLVFWTAISRPLARVADRTVALADGDLTSDVPHKSRPDEVGATARNLETLRAQLEAAEEAKYEAMFQGKAFASSSAPLVLADTDMNVKQFNSAFRGFVKDLEDGFGMPGLAENLDGSVGQSIYAFHDSLSVIREQLKTKTFPVRPIVNIGDYIVTLNIGPVRDENEVVIGYLVEWRDNTEALAEKAIIKAIDAGQLRAEFDDTGVLRVVNGYIADKFPSSKTEIGKLNIRQMLVSEDCDSMMKLVRAGESKFGKFDFAMSGEKAIVSGSLSPLLDLNGKPNGFIFIAKDVTREEETKARIKAEADALKAAQDKVVAALTDGLGRLSEGDLSLRITEPFAPEYEILREQFNKSVAALDEAVSLVVDNSSSILSEASNISGAAGDLSKRTEQQAATLEQFVAALTELTASVSSAAQGATEAREVVDAAKENAEASGSVVREAVEAMGEISASSEQIGRIIGVIDEIAFQTNLLALNAGVEAARAGDAGRGFAVVASEVRALAQRSSDAAREINTLISTSGNQVKRGVSLVDKAGQALTEIVDSVGGIADNVATIAASAKEQSAGLSEISTSINQLDQVTQQNVAMFEETTAATHTLTNEANALVSATRRFSTTANRSADKGKPAEPQRSAGSAAPKDRDVAKAGGGKGVAETDGALALALEDGDWEDF